MQTILEILRKPTRRGRVADAENKRRNLTPEPLARTRSEAHRACPGRTHGESAKRNALDPTPRSAGHS